MFPAALLLTDEEKQAIRKWVDAVNEDYKARTGKRENVRAIIGLTEEDCCGASPVTFRVSASGIGDCKSAMYRRRVLTFGYDDDGTFFAEVV
jgi:hypothetical protein